MLERNSLIFDGEKVINTLKKSIKKLFKSDEWVETFDGNEVGVITYQQTISDNFPIIFLEIIDDSPYTITRDSNQIANHTRFTFRITIYNKESKAKKLDRETLSRRIANEVILHLQKEYGYAHDYNQFVPNEDITISRRVIGYTAVIDNNTYAIYNQ